MAKSLLEVLRDNGLELKESSQERWVAVCPFHQGDRDPSFTVYPNNTYYCFGCEEWGDALKFLVEYKHITTEEAISYLGEDFKFPQRDKQSIIKVKNVSLMWKFLDKVTDDYHQFLLRTPGALNYLQRRGLTLETIQKYRLGYTDGHVLSLFFKQDRELALEAGVMARAGYEALSHRITIPNIIGAGVDFMVGRTVVNDNPKYLGIRTPKPLFGFYEVRNSPLLYVVEGQFDWLLLRQWGYPAINMSGHHVPSHMRSILRTKFLVIVPDYDENETGQNAALSLHNIFPKSVILDYSRLKEGESLDVGSLGERSNGEQQFAEVVGELWNTFTSINQLNPSLSSLREAPFAPSTLKLQV